MSIETDDGRGQSVGSHTRLSGRVFGLRVFLDQVVTRRTPPREKVWQTVGTPKLLVIGHYRMGAALRACNSGSELRVFIDYELPVGLVTHWLGRLFGGIYARWCVEQMITDAVNALAPKPAAAAA